ncbi:16S rRNA (cytosine(1402)-N(4))-methyltransferase RsmH [bacterium]|nr:16S rRNA (cytosine(1402)-N(4))-methyltransferase RsmH [bacterium]
MVTSTRRAISPSPEKHSYLTHTAVMANEVVSYLLTDLSGIYVDCTLGAGGHAMAILRAMTAEGRFIGIDRDKRAIVHFQQCSERWSSRITLFHSPYALLGDLLRSRDVRQVDGVLFDLGVASFQIDEPERGFSYLQDGPLDMRMDTSQRTTARLIVNEYGERALASMIRDNGGESRWRKIARAIIRARERASIETTLQLADIIRRTVPGPQAIKSLARVFQAIRIQVNGELEEFPAGLKTAVEFLKPGGRLVILCYQSLEDRAVKELFARFSGVCQCPKDFPQCVCGARKVLKVLTRRAVRPTVQEVERNSRARGARLRAAQKISS